MRHNYRSAILLQQLFDAQSDWSDDVVHIRLEALEFCARRENPDLMKNRDSRPVLQHKPRRFGVILQTFGEIGCLTGRRQCLVNEFVAVFSEILGALARYPRTE